MAVDRLELLEGLGNLLTEDEASELEELKGADAPVYNEGHYENLAERMDRSERGHLAQQIIFWYKDDEESRREWQWRMKIGIRLLGVSQNKSLHTLETDDSYWTNQVDNDEVYEYKDRPFERASSVIHPLLMEAVNQFYSRSVTNLWPEDGPVQAQVMGEKTPERAAQAERVRGFMNYQYNELMPAGYESHARLFYQLPMWGSVFKKSFYDPGDKIVDTMLVDAQDFVVPYTAQNLRTAARYTQVIRMVASELEDKMADGFYRQIDLDHSPEEQTQTERIVEREIDSIEGKQPTYRNEDGNFTLFETHVDLKLDVDGGELRPYVVTVLSDQDELLSVRRNWHPDDERHRRRQHFTHYYFMPGLGFYGFGFLHILGDLAMAATGALRSLLDSASFANMQGGFHSEDIRMDDADLALGPGEWRAVRSTLEDLGKGFMTLPYKEPSSVLFQLLGHLEELGRRLGSTTELMVGDVNKNIPVGTVLALIEQGQQVFSAIHRGNQRSMRHEFKRIAALNAEHLPQRYPYLVRDADREVFRADFDERVDVLPVADPNIVTATERIAQAEAVLQQADKYPHLYDLREANRRMLMALRVGGISELLPNKTEVPARDPVSENVAMLTSQPVRVYPTDQHEAHMLVHEGFFMMLEEADQKRLEGVYTAHMAEHKAQLYVLQMEQQIGMRIPIPSLNPHLSELEDQDEVDPETIEQVTELAAMVVQQSQDQAAQAEAEAMAQQQAAEQQALQQQAEQQAAIEAERMQRQQTREDAKAQAHIQREDAKAQAAIERDNTKTAADLNREVVKEEERLVREFVSDEAERAQTGPTGQPEPPFGGAV